MPFVPNTAHSRECSLLEGTTTAPGFETLAVHGGNQPDAVTGAVLCPIYAATTFAQPSVEHYMQLGYSYSRQDNPTVRSLEHRIAVLEGGVDAVCVSSGMAATVAVFSTFLTSGDHCVLTECSYGGTNRCARVHFSKYNIEFSYVDMRDLTAVEQAIKPNTRLIFSESPTNPVLHLADVTAISSLAKRYSEKNGSQILHACDSTFATPYIMQPLKMGADLVVQSLTKYYDGHNVAVGGAVIVSTKEQYDRLALHRNILGSMMSPAVAFHIAQTVKTLPLRIEKQSRTAMEIALFLEKHSAVDVVYYPGLSSYPQKALAQKQHSNSLHGGMVSFEVRGGSEAGRKLMNTVKRPWILCENLGACESIITCPSVFTHANMRREDRLKIGITDGLVRLSCGVEDSQDLMRALKNALDAL